MNKIAIVEFTERYEIPDGPMIDALTGNGIDLYTFTGAIPEEEIEDLTQHYDLVLMAVGGMTNDDIE